MSDAAAAVDFTLLLAQKPDDTVRPEPLPPGTYRARVKKYTTGVSSQKKTPYVEMIFGGFQPEADVDQEAWGRWNTGERLAKAELSEEFYITDSALFRLKDFLEDVMGISTTGRSYADCLSETPNMEVLLSVGQVISTKDNKTVYAEIKGIAKAA